MASFVAADMQITDEVRNQGHGSFLWDKRSLFIFQIRLCSSGQG
jgi:hypothetical protein